MAPKTILSNEDLGKKIKVRRNELRLTIEEAASRAGVRCKKPGAAMNQEALFEKINVKEFVRL